ncbi:MAG: hypothetical protein OEY29_02265 [Gammaproteobacteria bacterium]|nr:hypothetical protein [Gammaproteobacteria bacterium]
MLKSYSVSSCCLTHADMILLEFLLSLLEKSIGGHWHLVTYLSADMCIIDIDKEAGKELYKKNLTADNSPLIIALTSDGLINAGKYRLEKPLRTSDFISLIKTLLETHPEIGREEDSHATLDTSSQVSSGISSKNKKIANIEICRPIKERLFNFLMKCKNRSRSVLRINHHGLTLYIDFISQQCYYKDDLLTLSSLFKADLNALLITEIVQEDLTRLIDNLKHKSIDELLWYSTLLGASGELDESIDTKTLLHLRRWPNLKSLYHLPVHLSLTAYMTSHTNTITEVISTTGINKDITVNFINACLAMNYLVTDSNRHTISNSTFINKSNTIHLFGRLRKRFSISTTS